MKKIKIILKLLLLPLVIHAQTPQLIKDISPGQYWSNPQSFIDINGVLFFIANDGTHGLELWKSDGTENGTFMVKDINTGYNFSNISEMTNINGFVYFIADDGIHGKELWKSDGTENGTFMVKDINTGINSANISNITEHNGQLYFNADDGILGLELWKSDGTTNGTNILKDIKSGKGSSVPSKSISYNGYLYFFAEGTQSTPTVGYWLWKSDGTENGTINIKKLRNANSQQQDFAIFNNLLYFSARGETVNQQGNLVYEDELWKTDGSNSGTTQFIDLLINGSSQPRNLKVCGNLLYFLADDGLHGQELWKTDGTINGTQLVKDIKVGPDLPYISSLININNELYFRADNGINGQELWKTNGSEQGTIMVKDLVLGPNGSFPSNLTNINNELYFVSSDGSDGHEIWKTDGSDIGTIKVTDLSKITGPTDNAINPLIYITNTLFFGAEDVAKGVELWKLNVTTTSTCTQSPTTPTVTASSTTINAGQSVTLSISSGNLNCSSASWKWHSGTCGGTLVGSGSSITVTPSGTTIYYVRGEGTGVNPGTCGSVTINVTQPNYGFKVTANGVAADGSSLADWSKAFWSNPYIPTGSSATIANPVLDNGAIKIQCNNVKLYNNTALNLGGVIIANNGTFDMSLPENQRISVKLKSSANVNFVLDVTNASYTSYFNWGSNRPNIAVVADGNFKWYTFDLKGKFTSTPDKAFMVGLNYISSTPFTGDIWIDEMLVGEFVPTITQTSSLSNFVTNVNTPSKAQSINISGTSLIDLINVNAPSGYEITTDTLGVWSSQLQVSGTNAKLFVRAKAQSASNAITGNLTLTSTAAVNVNIPLNGSVINGINDKLWSNQIKLIPNPVIDYLEISSEQKSVSKYTIYSSLGEIVLSNSNWSETEKIDVRHLPSGIYIIKVSDYENAKIIKFVKH